MIDFRSGTLANRALGTAALQEIKKQMDRDGRAILLDFGANIATMSWLDTVLCDLLRAESRAVVLLSESEDMREHVDALLQKRHLAVYVARNFEEFCAGNWTAVGHVSEAQKACIEVLRRMGDVFVADIAQALHLSVEATQLRLNELLALHLVERRKQGKAYIYLLPEVQVPEVAAVR